MAVGLDSVPSPTILDRTSPRPTAPCPERRRGTVERGAERSCEVTRIMAEGV